MRTPPIVGLYAKTIRNRRLAARDLSSPCHCEERRDEVIHSESPTRRMDCFASLAMTGLARGAPSFPASPLRAAFKKLSDACRFTGRGAVLSEAIRSPRH